MRRLVLLAAVGCGGGSPEPAPSPPPAPPPPQAKPAPTPVVHPRHAPHASMIERFRLTPAGDAAFTVDLAGAMRLWPTLDGTHEPVVVAGTAPIGIAMTRGPMGDLVVALLDEAGGIALRRFAPDGTPRSTASLSPDPGFTGVVASDLSFLACTRDGRIVRLREGAVVASLEAGPGERVLGVFARAALVARRDGTHELRTLQSPLAWGEGFTLPGPIGDVVLSPSGTRAVGVLRDTGIVRLELAHGAAKIVGRHPAFLDDDVLMGGPRAHGVAFVDDDHVYWGEGELEEWKGGTRAVPPMADVTLAGGAILGGSGAAIAIARDGRTTYLGYGEPAPRDVVGAGAGFAFTFDGGARFLDASLRSTTVTRLDRVSDITPLDARLVLVRSTSSNDKTLTYELIDAVTRQPARPALPATERPMLALVEPATHLLALADEDALRRYRVDPVHLELETLPALPGVHRGDGAALLDPTAAGGADAVIAAWTSRGNFRVSTYAGSTTPRSAFDADEAAVLGIDRAGAVYFRSHADVHIYRGDKLAQSYTLAHEPEVVAWHPSGAIATVAVQTIAVLDAATGRERWHERLAVESLVFSGDGATLVAVTKGGLVAFDASTGKHRGTWCGTDFGIRTTPPAEVLEGISSVCAE